MLLYSRCQFRNSGGYACSLFGRCRSVEISEYVRSGVSSLGLNVELELKEKLVNGIGTRDSQWRGRARHHCHRSLMDIMEIIDRSDLPESVKGLSYRIFERIAQAEAKVREGGSGGGGVSRDRS